MTIPSAKNDIITSTIKDVVGDLLNRTNKGDFPAIPFDELTAIINKYNDNNVLNDLNLVESRKRLNAVIKGNKGLSKNIYKTHYIYNNFLKGMSLIREANKATVRTYSNSPEISIPVLDVDALKYRYNNDKETYIVG